MSSFKIRPRFKHFYEGEREEIENQIVNSLNKNADFIHSYLPGHIYVKIHPLRQHFWSPQLHLSLEQDADKVIIRGLYGPNPTVWAIFFFSYLALGILSLFLGMWGLTRWSLGMDHAILWAIPVFAVIAVILYLSAQAGQKLGAQQMFDIHHFYEAIAEDRIEID